MKVLQANRISPDGMPRSAASHVGLFCLPMSHKRDARLLKIIVALNVFVVLKFMDRISMNFKSQFLSRKTF